MVSLISRGQRRISPDPPVLFPPPAAPSLLAVHHGPPLQLPSLELTARPPHLSLVPALSEEFQHWAVLHHDPHQKCNLDRCRVVWDFFTFCFKVSYFHFNICDNLKFFRQTVGNVGSTLVPAVSKLSLC